MPEPAPAVLARARARAPLAACALGLALLPAACGTGEAARSLSTRRSALESAGGARRGPANGVRLQRIASLDQPVYVTGPPRDPSRLFVLQRGGQVMLLRHGRLQTRPFLTTGAAQGEGGSEQGLLGIAFAPDYLQSGIFYVDYTLADNNIAIVQYRRSAGDPDLADPASARTVLRIDHHAFTNHNGGQLAFGPEDDLYIGVGDGGSEGDPDGNGQNANTLLGKILRIHPSPGGGYSIPAGNPFVGKTGKRPQIWAYGLRNPWRFSFDRATGDMAIGDVGQDREEEIDFAPRGSGAGANYGWSVWEGDRRNKPGAAPGTVSPSLTLFHDSGYCAIIGGYVVRDRSLPGLYGRYLFGDFCHPQIESVKLSRGHSSGLKATGLSVEGTSSLGQDASGHIFVTSLQGGLYRIVAAR